VQKEVEYKGYIVEPKVCQVAKRDKYAGKWTADECLITIMGSSSVTGTQVLGKHPPCDTEEEAIGVVIALGKRKIDSLRKHR